jgi:hypothetical protein
MGLTTNLLEVIKSRTSEINKDGIQLDISSLLTKQEIHGINKTRATTVAQAYVGGLLRAATYAITNFYFSYDPLVYHRVGDMLNNSSSFITPVLEIKSDSVYGGIKVSEFGILNNPSWSIFEDVWVHGRHGHNYKNLPRERVETLAPHVVVESMLKDLRAKYNVDSIFNDGTIPASMQYDIESYVARESYSDRGYDNNTVNGRYDSVKMWKIEHGLI